MIISRYLSKEIFTALLAATLILLLIFISEQLLSYMRATAAGRLSVQAVSLLLTLQIPVLLSFLLPLSLFLGVLLAFGRLYADSEMTVLFACGVGPERLFRIVLTFALIMTALVAMLSFWIAPTMEQYSARILAANKAEALTLLQPGKFNSIVDGKWVFYAEDVAQNKGQLQSVFAAQKPTDTSPNIQGMKPWGVMFAKSGYQKTDTNGSKFLVLTDGYRYNGLPGKRDYQIISFAEYGVRLARSTPGFKFDENVLSTKTLWKERANPVYAGELHWRASLALAPFILSFLAVPLSKVKPRYGRYFSIVPAVFCYIIYANLMFLGRAWLVKGSLPMAFGMWWVHILMFGFAIFLSWREQVDWRKIIPWY
ncbi:MAG: LPS export ABC transporter permease LptF [Gammaproteobacteria bacterium]